jgi:capsule polysaccharide modification protein KpsS
LFLPVLIFDFFLKPGDSSSELKWQKPVKQIFMQMVNFGTVTIKLFYRLYLLPPKYKGYHTTIHPHIAV